MFGAAIACGDGTEQNTDGGAGPLNLRPVDDDGPKLVWEDAATSMAEGYQLTGEVRFGPTCQARRSGVTGFETISISEDFDGTQHEYTLPAASNDDLEVILWLSVTLDAFYEGGETVTDAIAFTADPGCD